MNIADHGVALLPHQTKDVEWLLARGNGLLGHEVGGGKTFPAIVAARSAAGPNGKILYLCPLTLAGQTRIALERCLPGIRVASYHSPESGRPYSAAARLAIIASPQTWDVLIGNYDLLPRLHKELSHVRWSAVICDEAHRLKGYRGQRSKNGSQSRSLYSFIDRIPFRVALTGTPIINGPEDAFGIFRAVSPDIFGDVLWKFQQDYFYDISKDRNYKILRLRPDKRDEFEARVNDNMRRLTKRQLMELYPGQIVFPEESVITYEVDMPPAVALAYRTMADMAMAEIAGKQVERRHILGRMLALQMLASGAYSEIVKSYDLNVAEDGEPVLTEAREVSVIDMSHKLKVIDEILSQVEPGQPVVLWAHFRHEIAAIVNHLAKTTPLAQMGEIHGGVVGNARKETLRLWHEGKINRLVCQPAAAGEGLNLQEAQHDIYLSRSHSLKDWEQAKGRTPRLGSSFTNCTHHVILARESMDMKIHGALRDKRALASSITRDEFLAALK